MGWDGNKKLPRLEPGECEQRGNHSESDSDSDSVSRTVTSAPECAR